MQPKDYFLVDLTLELTSKDLELVYLRSIEMLATKVRGGGEGIVQD